MKWNQIYDRWPGCGFSRQDCVCSMYTNIYLKNQNIFNEERLEMKYAWKELTEPVLIDLTIFRLKKPKREEKKRKGVA